MKQREEIILVQNAASLTYLFQHWQVIKKQSTIMEKMEKRKEEVVQEKMYLKNKI